MILPGRQVLARGILRALVNGQTQVQPCGVDLSLKRVLTWTDAGVVDFDNRRRRASSTSEMPFDTEGKLHLPPSAYLVEFNERVSTPLDAMGQIFVRSSLFRSGALLTAGVMDAGYEGALGALLQVVNPQGLVLWRGARLGQVVFHQMAEKVEGYKGVYQGKESV